MVSQTALKEWAVVVAAIARGQVGLLLRKGGIADPDETFSLAHREFFLFPTREHQRREQVRPEFHPLFDEVAAQAPSAEAAPGPIRLTTYAGVAGHWRVTSAEQLRGLEHTHLWTADALRQRLAYKPQLPTVAVVLRAYRLPTPPVISPRPEYAGCKSWVPLAEPWSVEGAVPILPNARFRQLLEEVAGRLAPLGRGVVPAW